MRWSWWALSLLALAACRQPPLADRAMGPGLIVVAAVEGAAPAVVDAALRAVAATRDDVTVGTAAGAGLALRVVVLWRPVSQVMIESIARHGAGGPGQQQVGVHLARCQQVAVELYGADGQQARGAAEIYALPSASPRQPRAARYRRPGVAQYIDVVTGADEAALQAAALQAALAAALDVGDWIPADAL
ncbi:MAG: hypothetical protein ACYTF0_03485 [Planctomycetota bacterium]|jgi:hypothetical protein